jgi:hypothetical protein
MPILGSKNQKRWIRGEMIARPHQSSKTGRTTPQIRMHAFREPILCKGADCKTRFSPKRIDQRFCSARCRVEYFTLARTLGLALLRRSDSNPQLKMIVNDLLNERYREKG